MMTLMYHTTICREHMEAELIVQIFDLDILVLHTSFSKSVVLVCSPLFTWRSRLCMFVSEHHIKTVGCTFNRMCVFRF